jgi:predicted neuraminidase
MNMRSTQKEFVFEDERNFASCHASTLVVLENAEVLAAWFGGTAEKNSDVAIWIARRDNAKGWTQPSVVADEEGIAHWNPILFQGEDGRLFLFYKVGHEISDWFTRVMVSTDGGYTWSEARELVPGDNRGGRGPVKNKPILLKNGGIAAPASIEGPDPEHEGKDIWEAFVDLSDDNGETWLPSANVPMDYDALVGQQYSRAKGVIQPTLWESGQQLHMLLRSTEGWIYRSDSDDGGATWSPAYSIGLPNNNSGIDLVAMDNGALALVYNPVQGYSTRSARSPLSVIFSKDNGSTWGDEFILEQEEGEYSYPAIVAQSDKLHITYTWKRERIVYWELNLIN